MTTERTEIKVYTEHLYCECGGEITRGDCTTVLSTYPASYSHSCNKCKRTFVLYDVFPRIVYEEVKGTIRCESKETKPTDFPKCDCFCEEQRIKGWLDGNTPITEPITVCNGTRERDECTCGGDKSKCDFYAKDYSYGY